MPLVIAAATFVAVTTSAFVAFDFMDKSVRRNGRRGEVR